MTKQKILILLLFVSLFVAISPGSLKAEEKAREPEAAGPVMVGRIAHSEGRLLRYVPEKEQWALTGKDTPFGIKDVIRADERGRAEIIMPNNTWVRIDGSTQIQLIAVEPDITEIDLISGLARFYSKDTDAEIKVVTPFGYVLARPGTEFDMLLGGSSVEVSALKGTVDFVHGSAESHFEVSADSLSILADSRQVASVSGYMDSAWQKWNVSREDIWAKRIEVKGASASYLPSGLRHEAYVLEKHGRWERVYYEGAHRHLWRPARVSAGWAPYTAGRWMAWYGDHCWVPAEPFGYVTHHYGNWVLVGSAWYWAPPVVDVNVQIGTPHLGIGFSWYPGRVAWVHSDVHFGWFPLAHGEIYYSHRYWGPGSVVVGNVNIANIDTTISRYRYFNRAVIINRSSLYSVENYQSVRLRRVNSLDIVNRYRMEPAISNTVLDHYYSGRRFKHGNVDIGIHGTAMERIHQNFSSSHLRSKIKVKDVRQRMSGFRKGTFTDGADIAHPGHRGKTHYKESSRYKSEFKSRGKGFKSKEKVHVKYHEKVKYSEKHHEKYDGKFKSHGGFKGKAKYHEKASHKEKGQWKSKTRGFDHEVQHARHERRAGGWTEKRSRVQGLKTHRQKSGKHEQHVAHGKGKKEKH